MKKMNRIISCIMVLCMVMTLLPVSALAVVDKETAGISVEDAETVKAPLSLKDRVEAIKENRPADADDAEISITEQDELDVTATKIEDMDINLKQETETAEVIAPEIDEVVRLIVVMDERSLLDKGYTVSQIADAGCKVVRESKSLIAKQDKIVAQINGLVKTMDLDSTSEITAKYNYSVALNGFAIEVPYGMKESIEQMDGVKSVFVAPQYSLPEEVKSTDTIETHMSATSATFGSAQTWDELGYTGAGMRIAVIDTGLDTDHPSFAAAPAAADAALTETEIGRVIQNLNAYEAYGSSLTAADLYISEKIPYGYNYVDESLDVTHDNDLQGDHGTHVSGIAAANKLATTGVVGVAPDAQVLVMKVFGASGGAYFDDIVAALEDCFWLNVDAVNMSLGSPAGFSDAESDTYVQEVFGKIEESDMIASISAGNSFSAAYMNILGTDLNFASDPDIGIVSSPATYVGSTMVGSVENVSYPSNYLSLGDNEIVYSDALGTFPTVMAPDGATEYTYVMVPGLGNVSDFAQVDVAGKIAVVQRGELAFTDKQTNAFNAGAIGCIVFDNVEGDLILMQDSGYLPSIFISLADGNAMAYAANENGEGTITVMPADALIDLESPLAGLMSDFSSWGVTPDLQLAPDVSAPGGNIYSCYTDGLYGLMSGTSMSAPHIAGMSAIVLQYLRENYSFNDAKMHTVAEALIMSTADPVLETTGIEYSPRKQGAGEANVYSAVTSPVYLTVNGTTPSVSMGDDDNKTGTYSFTFELNNMSDSAQAYILDSSVLTDQVIAAYGFYFMSETSCELDAEVKYSFIDDYDAFGDYDVNGDGLINYDDVQYVLDVVNGLVSASAPDLDGDAVVDTKDAQWLLELIDSMPAEEVSEIISVPAGASVTVTVQIALSDDSKAYMDTYYENGIYVDGFIRCYAVSEDVCDLSLPFMGFYGDWSAADVFDTAWYYETDSAMFNRYPNYLLTDIYYLGMNPYIDEPYDPAHNVISPNGDGAQDLLADMYLGLMRNARSLDFTWTNEAGETLFERSAEYVRKSYYLTSLGFNYPFVYTEYLNKGINDAGDAYIPDIYDFTDAEGNVLPDGSKVTLQIDAYVTDGDNVVDQSLEPITMIVDNTAPVVESVELEIDPVNGSRKIVVTASDNYDIAAIIPVTMAGEAFEYYAAEGEKNENGESVVVELDVSDIDSRFVLAVCDYGANESFYEIAFNTNDGLNENRFYAYRRYSTLEVDYYGQTYYYLTDAYNGWVSFETPDSTLTHTYMYDGETAVEAAEYIDGYVFGVDITGEIFVMKSGDWTRIPLGTMPEGRNADYDYVPYPALDMAYDYLNDVLYILTDELVAGDGGHLMTLDYMTGEITDLGIVRTSEGSQPLTLACDNYGVLYTIDYATGDLYTIDPTNIETVEPENWWEAPVSYVATELIGETGYLPRYTQTMTVDHETNTLYWLAYQGSEVIGGTKLFAVNTETAELTEISGVEYNSEMTAMFKPFKADKVIIPDAELEAIELSSDSLVMSVGSLNALTAYPVPFNADLVDVVWTSSDENVVIVEDGIVYAVGEGSATITATSGDCSAECAVDVINLTSDLTLFDYGNSFYWQTFNAAAPGSAAAIETGVAPYNGFTGAAYYDGWVYASEYTGGFYRLDPVTLEGTQIGSSGASLLGMAFNYADGYMYGIEQEQVGWWEVYNYVSRVNLNTGALERICAFDSMYAPQAYMAIDYDGNFYSIVGNNDTYGMELIKWTVSDNGMQILGSWSMDEHPVYNYSSMVYSEQDGGLFYSDDAGQLLWIDIESLTDENDTPRIVPIGYIGEPTGYAMNMGMFTVPAEEPAAPAVEITDVNVPDSALVLVGGSVSAGVSVEPWNAHPAISYAVEDESIATVDENGSIVGVAAGTTTVTVTVEGWDAEVTIPVMVVKSTGIINGFLITDFMYSSNFFISVDDADPVNSIAAISDMTDFAVFSGAYHDGVIYGYGQDQTGMYDYKNYFLTIDAETFEIVKGEKIHYTLRDMAYDYTTGYLFAIAEGAQYEGAVAQVNTETGKVTIIADTGMALAAMTIDANGQMYVISEDDNLYKVDKNSAEYEFIGSTGVNAGAVFQSMHYDYDTGNTYWAQVADDQTSSLRIVDLSTGSTTSLGTISASGAMVGALYTVPENEPAEPDAENAQVTGIFMPEVGTVVAGETMQLEADVLCSVAPKTDVALSWSSDNEAVATVDANGLVTGVAAGTAVITAEADGVSAKCEVIVTAEKRLLYAYDKTNTQWISFAANDPATIIATWDDAEGDAALAASVYTGETIYAYDVDGKFYEIAPDTFQRSFLGNGISGMTYVTELTDWWGDSYEVECALTIVDMSYDNGKLYAAVKAENPDEWVELSIIAEINTTDGSYTTVYESAEMMPANLLVENGRAYFVDGYMSGMLTYLDIYTEGAVPAQAALVQGYWGYAEASVALIKDQLTGTVYSIRDFTETNGEYDADWNFIPWDGVTGNATLCTLDLADADIVELGTIGTGLLIKGMFIK